jgi:tRNA G18 (ribose-2'-O)-methylase SpoU
MPTWKIDNRDDPRLLPYLDLPRGPNLGREGLFVAEGEKLVLRLLSSPFEVQSILISETLHARLGPAIPVEIPVFVVPDALVSEVVGFKFHHGILACGMRQKCVTPDEILARHPERLRIAVLPSTHDPENLGAIIRTCAGLGVHALMIGKPCGDPFARRVVRVSMGAAFQQPIIESEFLFETLQTLTNAGVELVATILDPEATPMADFHWPDRMALLLGNEAFGLEPEYLALCRHRVTLQMANTVDSLNVAAAAAIFLHAAMRE